MCEFLKICWCIFGNFKVKILFYWVIENVGIIGIIGIVEVIEEFWSLWHSFASWLYEEMKKKNCEKCMKWKKIK